MSDVLDFATKRHALTFPSTCGDLVATGLTKREYAAIQIAAGMATRISSTDEAFEKIRYGAVRLTDMLLAHLEATKAELEKSE